MKVNILWTNTLDGFIYDKEMYANNNKNKHLLILEKMYIFCHAKNTYSYVNLQVYIQSYKGMCFCHGKQKSVIYCNH